MKNVKSVNLILENCEVINIEPQYLGQLLLDKIRTKVYRIAMNSISKMQVVNRVAIEIFSEANVPYDSFGEESKETIFERLSNYNDIAQIELIYDDDCKDTEIFVVNWEDDDKCGCTNKLQKSYISKPGNLYITIGRKLKFKDVFDKEEIEDEQCMMFAKSMVLGDNDECECECECGCGCDGDCDCDDDCECGCQSGSGCTCGNTEEPTRTAANPDIVTVTPDNVAEETGDEVKPETSDETDGEGNNDDNAPEKDGE